MKVIVCIGEDVSVIHNDVFPHWMSIDIPV
jgi:hypothetical protein